MKIDSVEPASHSPAKQPCEHSVWSVAVVQVEPLHPLSSAGPERTFASRQVVGAGELHVVVPHVVALQAPAVQPLAQVSSDSLTTQLPPTHVELIVRSVEPLQVGEGSVQTTPAHGSARHAPAAQPSGQSMITDEVLHVLPVHPAL
jgi:hypothetical protein